KRTTRAGTGVGEAVRDAQGGFVFQTVAAGDYKLTAAFDGFVPATAAFFLAAGQDREIVLQFRQMTSAVQAITVVATVPSSLTPDPAQTVIVHAQCTDSN